MTHKKTFDAISKLKEVELELHRLKNALEMANRALDAQRTHVKLNDEDIWNFWCLRPEIPEGENDSMEAEFVAAVRAVLAAYGIKE